MADHRPLPVLGQPGGSLVGVATHADVALDREGWISVAELLSGPTSVLTTASIGATLLLGGTAIPRGSCVLPSIGSQEGGMGRLKSFTALAIVAALVTSSGCSSEGTTAIRTDSDRSGAFRSEVPSRFATGEARGIGDRLVLVGGTDPFGTVLDYRTGDVTDVEDPTGDELNVLDAESDGERLVVVGFTGEVGSEDENLPTTRVSFALDPASGEWTELDLPAAAAGAGLDARFTAVAGGPTGVAGVFGIDGHQWLLATANASGWTPVAEFTSQFEQWCATDAAFYALEAVERPERRTDTSPHPADLHLIEARFDGSAPGDVDLPPLRADFGAAGVDLGCSRSTVSILTGSVGEPPANLFTRTPEGGWSVARSPEPESKSWSNEGAHSDPAGVYYGYAPSDPSAQLIGKSEGLILQDDGSVVDLDVALEDTKVVWARGAGRLLVMGPIPVDDQGSGPPAEGSVGLTVVEIGQ